MVVFDKNDRKSRAFRMYLINEVYYSVALLYGAKNTSIDQKIYIFARIKKV